ncbi:MAG: polysaccharide deacetylase family protein [Cyanobacteriota bacterium]|nr:polysaccharide deacetylase family protein [Cyanobacteriota bacterium]
MQKTTKLNGQKRKFLAALVAASGSFIVGVFLPMDMWANSGKSVNQPTEINAANTAVENPKIDKNALQEIVKIKPAVATTVKASENALTTLELKRFNFAIPSRFHGTVVKDLKLTGKDKYIALTFDDGPWPKTTEKILDILKENEIKATFFVVGQHLKDRPELAPKIVDGGHVLANHTWNHPTYKMGKEQVQSEVGRTAELIYELTGMTTTLFRPPGGVLNNGLADFVKNRKHVVVMWSADSVDWHYMSASEITNNVVRRASNGGIVLLHDGGGPRMHVVKALPQMIERLRKQGYKFVTVPELLEIKDRELKKQEKAKAGTS